MPTRQNSQVRPAGDQTSALDAHARAAGFRNYAEMKARLEFLQRQREEGAYGNMTGIDRDPSALPWYRRMWNEAMAWHPMNTLQHVADLLEGANGNGNDWGAQ